MAGYIVELYSNPATTATDANGRYTFDNVDYVAHSMIIKTAGGNKVAEFELTFKEGEQFSMNMTEKGVNITYTQSTEAVNIEIKLNPDLAGAEISRVSDSVIPHTGSASDGIDPVLLWIGGGSLVVLLGAAWLIIALGKKKKRIRRK